MSRETTFERDLHAVHDRAELGAIFTRLCAQVAEDLQRKGYVGRTIGIKLRFADFKSLTRDLTIATPTADAQAIRHAAGQCLKRAPLARRFRLLGVRVGALQRLEQAANLEPNQPLGPVNTGVIATNTVADDVWTRQLF
jgi:DNA polymerase-4